MFWKNIANELCVCMLEIYVTAARSTFVVIEALAARSALLPLLPVPMLPR